MAVRELCLGGPNATWELPGTDGIGVFQSTCKETGREEKMASREKKNQNNRSESAPSLTHRSYAAVFLHALP